MHPNAYVRFLNWCGTLMNSDWVLQTKETRRDFASATWIPLRASQERIQTLTTSDEIGYVSEFFGCGSVAFAKKHREQVDKLDWNSLGLSNTPRPHAYEDGYYSPIDAYQCNDKEPIGVHLVFIHDQPVIGGSKWILNPDLVIALRLIHEGGNWVRPEEDFVVVAREVVDKDGNHEGIEIKRTFLIDYLAARGLDLRLSYYRQRVENVASLESSNYKGLETHDVERDHGRFSLLIRKLDDVFGGSWASFKFSRTDFDIEEDAPVLGPEDDGNTELEESRGNRAGAEGIRIEGEFWKSEWIDHQSLSVRVRGDIDTTLPAFIVDTDGSRLASSELNHESVGRWLWFQPRVVTELLSRRGFGIKWHTSETGSILSTSSYSTHFGLNSEDFVTIYAYDIARLPSWEQHVWAANNVSPEGKVSLELVMAQVKCEPASTAPAEELLFESFKLLENDFREKLKIELFNHVLDENSVRLLITRFHSKDQASLLRLAKDIVRIFTDRLNVRELRKISQHSNKETLGSNKLLQDILARQIGDEEARKAFGPIVGTYDLRLGDAHPTGSKINEALVLAGIDHRSSHLRQGQQLIMNFAVSVLKIDRLLFRK
jgi:hypothetical protein